MCLLPLSLEFVAGAGEAGGMTRVCMVGIFCRELAGFVEMVITADAESTLVGVGAGGATLAKIELRVRGARRDIPLMLGVSADPHSRPCRWTSFKVPVPIRLTCVQ